MEGLKDATFNEDWLPINVCYTMPNFALSLQEACLSAFRKAEEKIHTIGCKLDTVFHLIRLGLFYMDQDLTKRNIDKAQR